MSRPDLTDSLIHFIKASPDGEAYEILRQIARDRALRGGSGFIKGAYTSAAELVLYRRILAYIADSFYFYLD
jgi:hypothetical protein